MELISLLEIYVIIFGDYFLKEHYLRFSLNPFILMRRKWRYYKYNIWAHMNLHMTSTVLMLWIGTENTVLSSMCQTSDESCPISLS
jgi:hypothetical protein